VIDPATGRRLAAVLVPIYDGPEGPTLLLIRRTTTVNHPGQVAFPGGRPEPGDASMLETALREAEEELGIAPTSVRITGTLPLVETLTSNWAISPFVGRLTSRPPLRLQQSEVAAVLDVPISALLCDGLPVEEEWPLPLPGERLAVAPDGARTRRVRYYPWGEDKIWGATGRMLESLVAALRSGTLTL
jgi:8-oxo-dGTP pyrophosphatase MutT (NUDIX family)